jgi:sugar phosphate isomerase/epimerase
MSDSEPGADLVYCSATDLKRPFFEKLDAVAGAGFQGISLTIPDYLAMQAAGISDADLLAAIRNSGLFIAEISTASRWLNGTPDELEETGIHMAATFGATGLNCTPLDAPFRGMDEAVEAFRGICDRAGRRGVKCHIEFVPWATPGNLETTCEIVRRADRANGGFMFDVWHHHHSGGKADGLRGIDPEKLFNVQLSDVPAGMQPPAGLTTTMHRLLPGEGVADVVGCIRVLDDIGVALPFGGEVPNPEWGGHPASYAATKLHAALVDVVTRARRPSA